MQGNPEFMRLAIELATGNVTSGAGGPFGAVIVRDGRVIATGTNLVTSTSDPTAHDEVVAIRNACRELGDFSLKDCVIYTSCEPCPMCLAAIYWARIPRVYYGNTRADAAAIGFDDDFIYQQIPLAPEKRSITMQPLLRDAAQAALQEWQSKTDNVKY